MTQVSRPVQVLLLVTVLFGAVWFVALRSKGSSTGGGAPAAQSAPDAPGAKGLTNAIAKAHNAVGTANAAGQRAAGETVTNGGASSAPAASAPAHAPARPATHAKAPTHAAVRAHHRSAVAPAHAHRSAAAATGRVKAVNAALRHHKAVVIAFYDPNAADSRLVAEEIRHVSSVHGRALVLAVPINELSRYDAITRQVQITVAPTTVVIDRHGHATTIVGFTDRFEIQQRLADALAAKR
jgi:tartrate dehydratase beta subunit/fumarate hydratase class I family protein